MTLLKGERPVDVTEVCVARFCVRLFCVNGFCLKPVDPTARVVDGLEVDLGAGVRPVKIFQCAVGSKRYTQTCHVCGWRWEIDRAGIPCRSRTNFSVGTSSNDLIAHENTMEPIATYTPDQLKLGGPKKNLRMMAAVTIYEILARR